MNKEQYEEAMQRIFELVNVSIQPGSAEDKEMFELCENVQSYQNEHFKDFLEETDEENTLN